jgi:hypothetical protein
MQGQLRVGERRVARRDGIPSSGDHSDPGGSGVAVRPDGEQSLRRLQPGGGRGYYWEISEEAGWP